MKTLISILCSLLLLQTIPFYGIGEKAVLPEKKPAEIAYLEPTLFSKGYMPQQGADFAAPSLTLRPYKNAFLAATLSGLCPGLGHVYLGDYKTAGALFGSSGVIGSLAFLGDGVQGPSIITLQNACWYSAYAAYRDARVYNSGVGYSYKMPTESFTELAWAPFQWSIIKKPEVWGGLLGAIALAAGITYLETSIDKECHLNLSPKTLFPLVAFPVGIGEESYFRGYLQSALSEKLTPWGGIACSSLMFGAVHLLNGLGMESEEQQRYYLISIPFITSIGAYFGWLTYKNRSLKESIALHSWYDFVLFLASYSTARSALIGKPSLAISIPF